MNCMRIAESKRDNRKAKRPVAWVAWMAGIHLMEGPLSSEMIGGYKLRTPKKCGLEPTHCTPGLHFARSDGSFRPKTTQRSVFMFRAVSSLPAGRWCFDGLPACNHGGLAVPCRAACHSLCCNLVYSRCLAEGPSPVTVRSATLLLLHYLLARVRLPT